MPVTGGCSRNPPVLKPLPDKPLGGYGRVGRVIQEKFHMCACTRICTVFKKTLPTLPTLPHTVVWQGVAGGRGCRAILPTLPIIAIKAIIRHRRSPPDGVADFSSKSISDAVRQISSPVDHAALDLEVAPLGHGAGKPPRRPHPLTVRPSPCGKHTINAGRLHFPRRSHP